MGFCLNYSQHTSMHFVGDIPNAIVEHMFVFVFCAFQRRILHTKLEVCEVAEHEAPCSPTACAG